ncbi:septal ring lytic transglycosylase RlpA family protein [Pelagibacterium xiamenense]|uniref:septal ring lytic transglycosylase RlpA family protein n=1 Tax=Pelagibacterium xiamenense TaxID=2901140 RepID=UPI001E4A7B2F|nr:septal ring lytic transglycosylase RlpA family protein [Pelagibacterium xiamenense]MCD7059101.1 septal ring lytic transglycosylase RlpA family protein [Pelagibacterium xiamenense]
MKIKKTVAILAITLAWALPLYSPAASAAEPSQIVQTVNGVASWYGGRFHGRLTANGERYNMYALTAAHRSLPFGTQVRVTNHTNGRSVIVRINDRGPYVGNRVIDLSQQAATEIGMVNAGVANVTIDILG